MASQYVTPESILPRSDSKNPASTCKGITSTGRSCRRALASPKSSPINPRQTSRGVLAVYQDDHGHLDAAAFYCWQHKDQAQTLVNQTPPAGRKQAKIVSLQERNSIDSLVARLGITSVQEQSELNCSRTNRYSQTKYNARERRHSPVRPSAPNTYDQYQQKPPRASSPDPTSHRKPKRPGFWASLCCMSSADDNDYLEVVRHKNRVQRPARRPETVQTTFQSGPPVVPAYNKTSTGQADPISRPVPAKNAVPTRRPLSSLPVQQLNPRHPSTPNLLSYIPPHLSPQATSTLLVELSKPISPYDTPGYIYIFWLTSTATTPSPTTAASLLNPPTPTRRISDVLSEYSYTPDDDDNTTHTPTIKLKIGRANNVHRRMNEWTRQCGHALSLVRWYPYVPSSAHASPATSPVRYPDLSRPATSSYQQLPNPGSSSIRPATAGRRVSDQSGVRMVPHAHRVERLIHLELAERRVKRDCVACGREHREWFEIEATQAGVKAVDEVVRRWVGWAESLASES